MAKPEAHQRSPIYPPPGGPQSHGVPMTSPPPPPPMYTGMPTAPAFQQPPSQLQPESGGQWSVGLFDCCSECEICCLSCWCPCITFGQVSEIIDRGSSSCGMNGALYCLIAAVTGCVCVYSCIYRTKMRKQYGLEGSPAGDFCANWCCEPCALTQQYRELQNRGFDVALGWRGNLERQSPGGVAMQYQVPPGVEAGMAR